MKKKGLILKMLLLFALLQPYVLRAEEDEDELDRKIEQYTAKIEANPKDVKSLMARGLAYNERGEFGEAANDFTHVCKLDPKNLRALLLCAEALSSIEDYDMAILTYSQVLQLSPKSTDAYVGRADARAVTGEYLLAVEDYTSAIALKKDINYVRARGWAQVQLGKFTDALTDFNEVVQKVGGEDGGICYCERGEAYLGANLLSEALADLDKGIFLAVQATGLPEEEVADNCHFLRGRVYAAQKNYDKALEELDIAITQNENLPEYYAARAKVFAALGRNVLAKKDEDRAQSMRKK